MKKLILPCLLLTIMMVACSDDDDGIITLTEQIELDEEFEVSVPQGVLTPTISITETLEIDNDDFDEFGNVNDFEEIINSVVIDSIHFEIDDYEGASDIQITDATISLLDADDDVIATLVLASAANPVNIKEYDDNNIVLIPNLPSGVANTLADSFLQDQLIKVEMEAEFSDAPVDFDFETTVYITLSGSPI